MSTALAPFVLEAPPATWDGFAPGSDRWVQIATRLLEVASRSAGVSLVALITTLLAAAAIFFSLYTTNILIGYDFSENLFSFLWNYNDSGSRWYYYREGHGVVGHFGLILGALVLLLSPYLLFFLPLALAVSAYHWIDRPFRRRRLMAGVWCANGIDDPARLGELDEDQWSRPSLVSPRMRTWLGRALRCPTILLTVAAYLLLLTVLKSVAQEIPGPVWIILFAGIPPVGFGAALFVLVVLFMGLCLSCLLPLELVKRILDGERPPVVFCHAFRSGFAKKGRTPRKR